MFTSRSLLSNNMAASTRQAAVQAERAEDKVRDLEERVGHLALLNMALWSLLQERLQITEEQLMARVQELDLRDGQLDGRVNPVLQSCPECTRPLSQRHRRCLYCDFELPREGFAAVVR